MTEALEYTTCAAAGEMPHWRSEEQGEATERRRNTFLMQCDGMVMMMMLWK